MTLPFMKGTVALPVVLVAAVLSILIVAFIASFLVPAIAHWFRLRSIQSKIARFTKDDYSSQFQSTFSTDKHLSHLWKEYQDSLHIQKEIREGRTRIVAVRATVPAEIYFNTQAIVDSRLRTEFFKHLPGIFTGIGIIGTFSGLIEGLAKFTVSEDAVAVRRGLSELMHLVGDAFLVSACAIAAAMLVTLFEKLLLASLYRRTEEIALEIDAKFDSGAGEEYLSRLVKSSEESATQSKLLKDALVRELGDILRQMSEAQIEAFGRHQNQMVAQLTAASKQNSNDLASAITEGIQKSLQQPLQAIAETVKSASGDQSATASRMLQDVMTSFSQKLSDIFGGQISGLTNLNQRTAEGIETAVSTLRTLVSSIESSTQKSADTMAERMARAVENLESRQSAMNEQTASFVDQIRQLVANSQTETSSNLQGMLSDIGAKVGGVIAHMAALQDKAGLASQQRESAMLGRTQETVSGISEVVAGAAEQMKQSSTQMANAVSALSQSTRASIDSLGLSAERIDASASRFSQAGSAISGVLEGAGKVSERLVQASEALGDGASGMREVLRDYQAHRSALTSMVGELESMLAIAKRDASLTQDLVSKIESASQKLGVAQKQADTYLDGVSQVLGEAHEAFATEIKRTLDKANQEFHTKLSSAVGMLSSAIEELDVSLSSLPQPASD